MKLAELEPQFLKWINDRRFQNVDKIDDADGIVFLCPLCMKNANMNRPGVHSVICWEPNVPQTTSPTPGRWKMSGTGYGDLTLTAGSSSILLQGEGCKAHFFITNGAITGI